MFLPGLPPKSNMQNHRRSIFVSLMFLLLVACLSERPVSPAQSPLTDSQPALIVETPFASPTSSVTLVSTVAPQSTLEIPGKDEVMIPGENNPTEEGFSLTQIPLRELAKEHGLQIGAAASANSLRNDPLYGEVLAHEFNLLTTENELKFGPVHPQPDTYSFADADTIIDFAQKHGMAVRGHVLVWHQQTPAWLDAGVWTESTLTQILQEHIQTVVGRYQGRIQYWDVVNEAIDDTGEMRETLWYRLLGQDYLDLAFQWTHESDPQAQLFYNDYNTEGMNTKSDRVYTLVKGMLERDVPIHGVGLQMHIPVDKVPAGLQANIQRLADLGLEVHITELDVRIPGELTLEKLNRQAETYRQVLEACLAVEKCTAFITWGFTDRYSWVPGFFAGWGSALLFDSHYRPKPAYEALMEALAPQ
jgi:endo-1,4-beta-xylanase